MGVLISTIFLVLKVTFDDVVLSQILRSRDNRQLDLDVRLKNLVSRLNQSFSNDFCIPEKIPRLKFFWTGVVVIVVDVVGVVIVVAVVDIVGGVDVDVDVSRLRSCRCSFPEKKLSETKIKIQF